MKKINTIIFLLFSLACGSPSVDSVISEVKIGIIEMNKEKILKYSKDSLFDYFEGDVELNPNEAPNNYYKLDKNGYYGKEKDWFAKGKENIIDLLTSKCRYECKSNKINFIGKKNISKNRIELILEYLCDADDIHLVFLKIEGKWKLAGFFFEAARVEPCKESIKQ